MKGNHFLQFQQTTSIQFNRRNAYHNRWVEQQLTGRWLANKRCSFSGKLPARFYFAVAKIKQCIRHVFAPLQDSMYSWNIKMLNNNKQRTVKFVKQYKIKLVSITYIKVALKYYLRLQNKVYQWAQLNDLFNWYHKHQPYT